MKKKWGLWVLWWLRFWARLQLKKYAPDVIGITGSAGKTSCRNAVRAILDEKYQVKVSYKANSESGIPLNILEIKPHNFTILDWLRMMVLAPWRVLTRWQLYEKYVVEMGIDAPTPPKNMEYLLTIVKPRTAIFLNVLPVHTAFFNEKGIKAIAQEKGKLITSLPENGLAILNANDINVSQFKDKTRARIMTFGKGQMNTVNVLSWQLKSEGTIFEFQTRTEKAKLTLPYWLPEHFGLTLAAAICVAIDEDFSLSEGVDLLRKNYKLPPGRATLFEGINGSKLIDSSYNASPQTMKDMLALLNKMTATRKLALLGDMRELGSEVTQAHEQIIKLALKYCDEVHLVGEEMKKSCLAGAVWHDKAINAALNIKPQPGDLILIKGSQNQIFLETAVEVLLKDKTEVNKLCRRGEFWEKQRDKV